MREIASKLVLDLGPTKDNPRNSEGSFIRLDDGTILFAYSRYSGTHWHDHQPCDIVLIRSVDEGETWSEPEVIVAAEQMGTTNVMSVSVIRQKDGSIGIYFLIKLFEDGPIGEHTGLYSEIGRAVSVDGKNFRVERCGFDAPKGYYVFNNDRLVRLSDGRLAYPASKMENKDGFATVFISEDDGATFRVHDRLIRKTSAFRSPRGLEEPGLIEHYDGSIRLWMRTDMGFQYECYSYDALKTFTDPVPSEFTSPRSPMEIERCCDGSLFSIYNPIPMYNGRITSRASYYGRDPLIIRKSTDDGRTWGDCYVIESDPERGFCYPAMFFTADDGILVAYCRGGGDDGFCLNRLGIRKISGKDIQ